MSSQDSNPPNVFISYSHDSSQHKEQVLELSDRLRDDGIDCNIDQYEEFSPPEGWPRWTERQIEEVDFVLVVCSEIFLRRLMGEETPGIGRGARWEGNAIYQLLYNAGTLNTKFIPVLLENGKPEHIPTSLQGTKHYSLSTEGVYDELYRKLTNQPSTPKSELGQRKILPPRSRRRNFPTSETEQQNTVSDAVREQSPRPEFFAYDDAWVGRENLINELTNKVKGSCRLLILVGITGIGKTALGERLAVELEDWFSDWNYYLQENFENEEQTSDFGSVAVRLLEKCGEVVTPDDRKDTQRLMNRLVRHLQENRYLIQLDSLENILEGNEEEGWSNFKDEWWVKFITTWLNVDTCESCLILTSQDLPAQIPSVGTRSQNFWLCQPLSGLEKLEQLALFKKGGLDVSEAAEGTPYLEKIGKAYEGHPLALRVIAGEIVNRPFNGNVLGYWNKYGKEVEEVEKAIEEPKTQGIIASTDNQFNLHNFTKNLRRNLKSRFGKVFNRLEAEAREAYLLLCESSVYRCEVPKDFWLSHLEYWDIDEDKREMALDTLRDRYLVEEKVDENNRLQVRQHNLIRSVSLENLRCLDDELDEDE